VLSIAPCTTGWNGNADGWRKIPYPQGGGIWTTSRVPAFNEAQSTPALLQKILLLFRKPVPSHAVM